MIRTQVQLLDAQLEALRHLSKSRNQSIAELVRASVTLFLHRQSENDQQHRIERAKNVAGKFSSGSADGSSQHDQHLAAAFGE